jgi:hypothetical protein
MSPIVPCNAAVFLFCLEIVKEFAMSRIAFSKFHLPIG